MKLSNDCVIIMCPPYPEFQEPPEDQSQSELFNCPNCNSQMWLSERKKGALMFSSCINKKIILGCYDCIKILLEESVLSADEIVKVDL